MISITCNAKYDVIKVKNKDRTKRISIKATEETKELYLDYKKKTGNSAGDIFEVAINNVCKTGADVGLRLAMIEEQLEDYRELLETINKKIDKLEHERIKLNSSKIGQKNLGKNRYEIAIRVVKSYFRIKDNQTNSFGKVNDQFDGLGVGELLCTKQNADYGLFRKIVQSVENNELSLDSLTENTVKEVFA